MSAPGDRYLVHEGSHKVEPHAAGLFEPLEVDGEAYGFEGRVLTPLGDVRVYAALPVEWFTKQGTVINRGGKQWLSMSAQVGGRVHYRQEERPMSAHLTRRGAAIVAHRWIRQLVDQVKEELARALFRADHGPLTEPADPGGR